MSDVKLNTLDGAVTIVGVGRTPGSAYIADEEHREVTMWPQSNGYTQVILTYTAGKRYHVYVRTADLQHAATNLDVVRLEAENKRLRRQLERNTS